MDRSDLERAFEHNRSRFAAEWEALLRFPSVSTDPAYCGDCARCAEWLAGHLRGLGFEARLLPTVTPQPVVFAERRGEKPGPTVLLYGHYDVQPVDPLDQWTSQPFEPTWRGSRLYARGAQDNKGQFLYLLKAVEILARAAVPLPPIKAFLEGEEESGSTGSTAGLPQWKDILAADVLLVSDSGMVRGGVPTIVMGHRGIVALTVTLSGPSSDLHSGSHGGVAPNPAMALARLLATLHDPDGRIAVENYYASIQEPSPEERRLANAVPFDPAEYRAHTGVDAVGGEPGYTPAERAGFRPTIEVNGVHSGYGGPGIKTIIPAEATAKLTARLVPDQDPDACLDAIERHLRKHAPKGLNLNVSQKAAAGPALRLDVRSPLAARAKTVLEGLFRSEVVFHWSGGSIPILSRLSQVSGAEPILVGMGTDEDRVHAPNESFSLEQFRNGFLYAALFLSGL